MYSGTSDKGHCIKDTSQEPLCKENFLAPNDNLFPIFKLRRGHLSIKDKNC